MQTVAKETTELNLFGTKIIAFKGNMKDHLTGSTVTGIARIGHASRDIQVAGRFLKLIPSRQVFLIHMLKTYVSIFDREDLSYYEKYTLADSLSFSRMMREYPKTNKVAFLDFFIKELRSGLPTLTRVRVKNLISRFNIKSQSVIL